MDKSLETLLSYLLDLRDTIRKNHDLSRNQLLTINGLIKPEILDSDIHILYDDVLAYMEKKHNADLDKYNHIVSRLEKYIGQTCSHEWIEDEIECPMSEAITTIRYCKICELLSD